MRRLWLLLFTLGLILRVWALPLQGSGDLVFFRQTALRAASQGVTTIYGPPDEEIRARGWRESYRDHAQLAPEDRFLYPPLGVYSLALAGGVVTWAGAQHGPLLEAAINSTPFLASIGIFLLLYRRAGVRAALLYWLSPAILLFSFLGYQDYLFVFLAIWSVCALQRERHGWAAALATLSMMAKPQGLFVALIVLAVIVLERRRRSLHALLPALGVAVALLLPFLLSGRVLALGFQAIDYVSYQDLSGNSPNGWWVLGWVKWMQVVLDQGASAVTALGITARPVPAAIWGPGGVTVFRSVGLAALVAFTALNLRTLMRCLPRDRRTLHLAAAMQVWAFNVLLIGSKENFFLAALPLLLLARPRPLARQAFHAVAIIYGLNLYLTKGVGVGLPAPGATALRGLLLVDGTLWLSLANLAAFTGLSWRWFQRGHGASDAPLEDRTP